MKIKMTVVCLLAMGVTATYGEDAVKYHVLLPLPYAYDALEPYIDKETMHLHHDKHQAGYVNKLNEALEHYPDLQHRSVEYLVKNIDKIPEAIRATIRHNAGGALNHTMFWHWMTPSKTQLTGPLKQALITQFGSVEGFKTAFNEAAKKVFGSGWAWLVVDKKGNLSITTTSNQDSPLSDGLTPILGLDVWEHAYYLKYNNRRPDYIESWWQVVNWNRVASLYYEAMCAMPKPMVATFIIPGITGDLAKRKILPALYELVEKGFNGLVVGTGRRAGIKVADLLASAQEYIPQYDAKVGRKLESMMRYHKLNVDDKQDFVQLASLLAEQESVLSLPSIRIVYLSTPPESFCGITTHLVTSGVIVSHNPKHRIAYEKPFGHDAASAREIQECIAKYLSKAQQYHVDHYLTKTTVATLPFMLSTNRVLEDSWNNKSIQSVSIFIDEKLGVEGRGDFYDKVGALDDIVQNHLLQLLTRLAAIDVKRPDAISLSRRAVELLNSIEIVDGVLGQYEGYHTEKGVKEGSRTETFVGLKLKVNDLQWAGVPFYIQTGKKLSEKRTEIQVLFTQKYCAPGSALNITIAPVERITLALYAKKDNKVTTVDLHSDLSPINALEGYEMLLTDLVEGRHEADVSFKEIEAQWQFVERVKQRNFPIMAYKPGTPGPHMARKLYMSTQRLPDCVDPKG